MGRVTLFLDCDAGIFARWLDDYTAGVSLGDFPTESGYLAVQRARVTQGPSHAPGRLDMEALRIVTPSNEDEIGQGAYLGSVVSFKVVPLASERIEVTAEYQHPAVQDYFGSLVDEIRKRWPETPASAPTAEVSGDWEAVPSKLPPNTIEGWLRLGEEQVTITKVENVLNTSFGQVKSETVEFVLNATAGAFVNWLESHASRLQFRPFPTTDSGSCMYLQPARVVTLERPSHLAPGLTKLLICAILPLPQGRAPPDPWPWSWMLTHEEAAVFEALCGTKPLPLPLGIEFAIATLDSERIEVSGRCDFALLSGAFHELLERISSRWVRLEKETAAGASRAQKQLRGGRPRLSHEELIYRLAKAQEATELRRADPDLRWKEIAKIIQWRYGTHERGLALLRDARHRLSRLEEDDPDGVLQEVEQHRKAKKTKET